MSYVRIGVGDPYPYTVPQQDGAILELDPNGDLCLMMQLHNIRPAELAALTMGFDRYSYFQTSPSPTLAAWVFKFPAPTGYQLVVHHAGLYADDRVERFLARSGNSLRTVVVDGQTVKLVGLRGLQLDAMAAFRETVARQATEAITIVSYNAAVNKLWRMNPEDIFRAGKQFRHGENV
jgi:hypothetical protein